MESIVNRSEAFSLSNTTVSELLYTPMIDYYDVTHNPTHPSFCAR